MQKYLNSAGIIYNVSSKKGIFLVIIILVIAGAIFVYLNRAVPPSEDASIVEADASFDVDENYFPEPPMTAIYFYENQLLFADDKNVRSVYLYWEASTDECDVLANMRIYTCSFDMLNNKFYLEDYFGSTLGPYSFTPGEVSSYPIKFEETGEKYYYLVSKDKKRFYIMLAAQTFNVQFGKKLRFVGMDADLDKHVELSYYAPALRDFEGISEDSTAIFEVDSDEDGKADIKFFTSPRYNYLAVPSASYNWQVLFWASPYWRGFNAEGAKKAPNGSVIIAKPFKLTIRMPERDTTLEELKKNLSEEEREYLPEEISSD